jgi:hypothetical protein
MVRPRLAVLLGLLSAWPAAAGAQQPNGEEFAVNAYTTGRQGHPEIAGDDSGHFVVVWDDVDRDGLFGRRFTSAGVPRGPEFRVNSYTALNAGYGLALAGDRFGNFVVTWTSDEQDGSDYGMFGQRFAADGSPVGGEFQINTYTTGSQWDGTVALNDAGDFVVVWEDYGRDGIFGRRYDAVAGFGSEFRVEATTSGFKTQGKVAIASDGSFVVVWGGAGPGDSFGVFGRRFDSAGLPLGGDFLINSTTTGFQVPASVRTSPDGSFVVTWDDYTGTAYIPRARRFDAAGNPQGAAFAVSGYTTGERLRPKVSIAPDGTFVVAWWNYPAEGDGDGYGIGARQFDAAGSPVGDAIQVNGYTTGTQIHAEVAAGPGGNFVVAWSARAAHDTVGVAARRFGDLVFADSFESGGLDAWSASQTDSGDLSVSDAAALAGSRRGMQALVDDTAGLFVQDDTPVDGRRYRARFYFDPNGFDPGVALNHRRTRIFIGFEEAPTRRLFAVVLRLLNGQYALMGRARRDDNSQADTSFVDITDAPHFVEVDWRSASGPDALDGSFDLWIDGNPAGSLAGVDNSVSGLDFVRLGALSVKAGASGVLRWDQFQSRRETPIGP